MGVRTWFLEIQVGHPVDEVEEAKRGGEKDARVRVYFGDADVEAPVPPRPRAAVLEAAEEAGAVLPVQALVAVLLVALRHVRGVVHLDGGGGARADVDCGRLWGKEPQEWIFLLLVLFGAGLPVADKVVQCAVLDERGEDEDEAHGDKQVHGGDVGDFGEGLSGDGTQGGHGQHCGDA